MLNLLDSVRRYAEQTPSHPAVVCGRDSVSYGELWCAIEKRSAELCAGGLEPNRPYVFRATQDIDFFVTYFGVLNAGAIAVPLENQCTEENFAAVKAEAEANTYADDIVVILYTTGTTGKSKGVMLSDDACTYCGDNFINVMPFDSELCFIISGPLNHIASLFKMIPTFMSGATVCVLDGLKDMNAFFACFDLPFKKFATFLVPASIRLLLQFSYDRVAALADRVSFIETGAAPITRTDMQTLAQALPKSHLFNGFGGTEIGCVCMYDFNDGKYMEGCIGHPLKNSSVVIGPEGNLVISGKTIMSGYVDDAESTARVLQPDGIHFADLGYVDGEGMVHVTGRAGDVINVGGFKINPTDVESAAMSHPAVKDCICIAATHPVIGTVLKLLVVLADGYELDKRSIAVHIKSKVEPFKVPTYYEAVSSIQRTFNGKLDRKYYREKR